MEQLSSPSAPTGQVSPRNSPMTDLLDGFPPNPPKHGKPLTCAKKWEVFLMKKDIQSLICGFRRKWDSLSVYDCI